jgi:RNA polymerase sigma-70 factor (ECF subfamily)
VGGRSTRATRSSELEPPLVRRRIPLFRNRLTNLTQDRDWIEWLRLKYGSELRRFLQHRVRDRTVVEDLEQDTYVKLQRLSEHDIRNPRSLLFTTAHHLAIDHLLRAGAERSVIERSDAEEVADTAVNPQRAAELDEAIAQMCKVLDELPRRLREAWSMRFVDGLSREEVAQALGITVDAVNQRLSRATHRLRDRLSRLGIDKVVRP